MKKISIIAIAIGILLLLVGIVVPWISALSEPPTVPSIGIIGGAESEVAKQLTKQLTYDLWLSSCFPIFLILGIIIIILGVVLLIIKNKK